MKISRFLPFFILLLSPVTIVAQHLQEADSLYHRGMNIYHSGHYIKAEVYLRNAFNLYKKEASPAIWLPPGIDYGEILVDRSKYQQALQLFNKLQKVAVAQNDIKARAHIENDLGWAYNKTGNSKGALIHLKKAQTLAKEAKDTLRLAYVSNNIGSIYYRKGDYKSALQYREQALTSLKALDDQRDVAIVLNNLALTYKKLILYDKALKYFERSLAIRKENGDINLLSNVYNNIASLYIDLGQLDKSLTYYQKSLKLSKESGNPGKTALTLNNIGTLFNQLGQQKRALAYYQQSLQLKKSFADPISLSATYNNMALRLWDLGQKKKSRAYFYKSLTLREKIKNPALIASTLIDLSQIELQEKHYQKSIILMQKASVLADSAHNNQLQSQTARVSGNIYLKKGDIPAALTAYKRSYQKALRLSPPNQILPLWNLAETYHKIKSKKALTAGQKVIDIIEKERSQVGSLSSLKTNYFKKYAPIYIELASWMLEDNKNVPKAYHLIEAAKARSLNDELAGAAHHLSEKLPDAEQLNRAQKITAINTLYTGLYQTSDSHKAAQIKDKIRRKELDYASYENNLHARYPKYKLLKKPSVVTTRQARELCDDDTAILEYAVASNTLIIFFITSNEIKAKHFALSSKTLTRQIQRFRKGILSQTSKDTLATLSNGIYRALIRPFEEEMNAYKNLLVIPDGPITYLPFDVLLHNNNYLVSRFNIKYVPSVTSFLLIRAPENHTPKSLLAIASSKGILSGYRVPSVPATNIEIDSIATFFDRARILKNDEASERTVKNALQEPYSFIHIAAHSIIDEQNPSLSGIVLAPSKNETGMGNDGFLHSSEISQLTISADMVVLSACKSGMGPLVNGEGMLSLQRALFVAGASTVVVSLWDVYDRSTAFFMQKYYRILMHSSANNSWQGNWTSLLRWFGWDKSLPFGDKASAMRKAKLAMLHNPEYKNPVFWAPFIVVGR